MPGDRETIRRATPADAQQLSALFFEVFKEQRHPTLWQWKYFDHPRGTFSMLCESEGRIVAHCGGTPVLIRDGAARYIALQSVDFMSSASYAGGLGGGGVFARTVSRFFDAWCGADKAALVYGFPGERHRLFGERVLRYRPIERVGELRMPAGGGEGVTGSALEPSKLALLSHDSVTLGAMRDETYLRWRYATHPYHRYETISVRSVFGGSLTAIVRRMENEVLLMELLGKDSKRNVTALARELGRLGLPIRAWASPAHPQTSRLRDAGFELQERDHLFEHRYFMQREAPKPGEFYYSLGDYDVY